MIQVEFSDAIRDRDLLGSVGWYEPQLQVLDALAGPERRHLLMLGRQSGKSLMLAAFVVWLAALRADLDVILQPLGTPRDVLIVCPRLAQAQEFIRTCAQLLSPMLGAYAKVLSDRIEFSLPRVDADGQRFTATVRVIAVPANARTIRGNRACGVVFDEMGFMDEAGGPGSAESLWRALIPSTRAFGLTARVLVSSTPSGRSGKFFELVEQARNGWAGTRLHHHSTPEMVPMSDEEQRELEDELGPVWFGQEILALEVVSGGVFFDLVGIDFLDRPAEPAHGEDWVLALDPAVARDRFGFALIGRDIDQVDQLLLGPCGSLETGSTGLLSAQAETNSFLANCDRIWAMAEPFVDRGLRVVSDVAKSQAVRSYFGRKGIEVEVVGLRGEDLKASFIATKTRLQDGSLRLWECADLLEDLRAVQVRDAGTIHLPRVRGRHADAAAALVLGAWVLRDDGFAPAGASNLAMLPNFDAGWGDW